MTKNYGLIIKFKRKIMLKNSKKIMLKLEIRANYNYEKKIKSTEIRY